jgi:signal transduction histidine kinase
MHSDFLPAELLSRRQVLNQAMQAGESAVLVTMLDTVQGMVALVNLERQIVLCNGACAKAGGLDRKEDAVGMRLGELLSCVHATDLPGGCGTSESCRYCGLAQAVVTGQQGRASSHECLLQTKDESRGIAAEYVVTVNPVSELGNGWVSCSFNDISSEKRREALERTFFHDIMNRAAAVEGASSVLATENLLPEERANFTEMLSVSAHALGEEIRSHRMLLSAERGQLAVESRDCDSLETLQEATVACRAFGFADGKEVAISPNSQHIHFLTDSTLLGRVLVNMLKNALEACDESMTVTATCTMHFPERIRFSIHNDAVIAEHVRAHIFQRSFTTKGPGRGLGTYSIKLLAETCLRGRAWFESAAGEGTTFHVDFAV